MMATDNNPNDFKFKNMKTRKPPKRSRMLLPDEFQKSQLNMLNIQLFMYNTIHRRVFMISLTHGHSQIDVSSLMDDRLLLYLLRTCLWTILHPTSLLLEQHEKDIFVDFINSDHNDSTILQANDQYDDTLSLSSYCAQLYSST